MPIRLTPAVKGLLIACFAGFVIQQTADQFFGAGLLEWFALIPSGFGLRHRFWQLLTYGFLHADVMHLFFNMMMLAFIGGELESAWGTGRFLRYYFFCQGAAGLTYLFLQIFISHGEALHTPMVGASGAIYGLLTAYGLIFGERTLLFMMLFPMKAKHFVLVLGAIELFTTLYSSHGGLASAAHLAGMVAGFAYLWGKASFLVFKRRQSEPGRRPKRKAAKHLKLVINNKKDFDKDEDDSDDSPTTWH